MKASKPFRYLLVGAWNTVFGYGAFALLYLAGRRWGVHYLAVAAVSHLLAVSNAYLGYKLYVFRSEGRSLGEFVRFSTVYLYAFVANLAVLPIFVEKMRLSPLIAQAIIVAATATTSYFAHNRFTFRSDCSRHTVALSQ